MRSVELTDFGLVFGGRTIFAGVTARLEWDAGRAGENVIALMGPSGAGKTSLARAIIATRYERATRGIRIDPADAVVGYLPQSAVLFDHLSIQRNALLLERVGRYGARFDRELFERLARSLRLDALLNSSAPASTLSGGEAQRLMLLRTLSVKPDILLLDEPGTGLDPGVREAFLIDLQETLERLNISALYISHHWDEVAFLAHKVAFAHMDATTGSVIELTVSSTSDFATAPPTKEAFTIVYGPGCSIWPLARPPGENAPGEAIACIRPIPKTAGFHRMKAFRLSRTALTSIQSGLRVEAAIYLRGSFAGWRCLEPEELAIPQ